MIIKDCEHPFTFKVNFVDKNNVCLGYSLNQQCCENADWFISDKIETDEKVYRQELNKENLENYYFDKDFIEYLPEAVVFRCKCKRKPDKYIHLFNLHNGYYSHGFTFNNGTEIIQEGRI